jgi:hypothetical protein
VSSENRKHRLLKTFWGWDDMQLPDGTVIWVLPERNVGSMQRRFGCEVCREARRHQTQESPMMQRADT